MDAFKPDEFCQKYEKYSYAALLLDSDFNIVYKNNAAKILNIKPRLGTSIKKYTDFVNLEKLCDAVEKEEFRILKLDVPSPIKRCVIHPENKDVTALIFYDALNFLKEDETGEFEIIRKIEDIIGKYNERRKNISRGDLSFENIENIENNENNKKILKINQHFRRHMANLNTRGDEKYKSYCDIGEFLNIFASGISQYINSFGYKLNFRVEDRMFYYRLNENDLLLINFIISVFALKYSVFNKADVSFYSDFSGGTLRYEFIAEKDFCKMYKEVFVKDYPGEINDMDYLELSLAALIAKNNDLKLRTYFDGDGGSKIVIDLIFPKNSSEVESPPLGSYWVYTPLEEIKDQAEIEFADII